MMNKSKKITSTDISFAVLVILYLADMNWDDLGITRIAALVVIAFWLILLITKFLRR